MPHIIYKCDHCYDRGKYYFWAPGYGRGLGTAYYMDCLHCTGTQFVVRGIDKDLRAALEWFRTSTPPSEGFRLNKFRMIDDPQALWDEMKKEIATDNIYRLEKIREDLISMQNLFSTADF